MKDKILQALKFILFLGIGVLLVWWVVSKLDAEQRRQVVESMRNANFFWLGISIFLGTLAQVSRTIRWQMLIKPLGYRPGFWNTLFAVLVSYMANMALPRLGEVSRCAIVNRYEKVPVQHLLGTVITERILDVIALAGILLLGFIIESDKIAQYFREELSGPLEAKLSSMSEGGYMLVILLGGMVTLIAFFFLLRKTILKLRFYHKVRDAAKGMLDGIKSVRNVDKPFTLVFHSVFIWLMYYAMLYVCIYSLPETSGLSIGAMITVFVAGAVAMIVVQGGIGAYPAFVMTALLLYNISEPIGFAFGWLVWSAQAVSILMGGTVALILLPIINKTSGKDDAQPEVTPV